MQELHILNNQALLEKSMLFSQLKKCVLEQEEKNYILSEALSYYELRSYLQYLLPHVSDSATKHVINELIKALGKLEFTSVKLPAINLPARIKVSPALIR
jgi:hypothetical protein